MSVLILILRIIFGVFFAYAGIMHFKKPRFFNGFIPDFLPKKTVNYLFGAIEILLGIGLFFNFSAKKAAFGCFVLMLVFLPLHIWDVFKEKPAIGSKKLAYIRLVVQFVFIYLFWLLYTRL